jgi:hypothetical protein
LSAEPLFLCFSASIFGDIGNRLSDNSHARIAHRGHPTPYRDATSFVHAFTVRPRHPSFVNIFTIARRVLLLLSMVWVGAMPIHWNVRPPHISTFSLAFSTQASQRTSGSVSLSLNVITYRSTTLCLFIGTAAVFPSATEPP